MNYILINRKERWGLSVYGWMVLILLIVSAGHQENRIISRTFVS
ncbi:MAG: hypothetical protein WCJ26_01900 [bacterium]